MNDSLDRCRQGQQDRQGQAISNINDESESIHARAYSTYLSLALVALPRQKETQDNPVSIVQGKYIDIK